MLHPTTGRFLEIYSNNPALNLNTGNDLPNYDKINPPDIDNYVKRLFSLIFIFILIKKTIISPYKK
jgi:hypothetical protein